jgi:hypothetical protein
VRALLLAALAVASFCGGASAQVRAHRVRWQFATRPGRAAFADVDALPLSGGKLKGRLRARVSLENPQPLREEGILVHYTIAAKFGEGWALPFLLDERRVPRLAPERYQEISLDASTLIDLYLKKMATVGQTPEALRLEIMVAPRKGEAAPFKILESVLPVKK